MVIMSDQGCASLKINNVANLRFFLTRVGGY